ncbi:MAG: hypothetical protein U0836_28190 [Pirellulales bacterium]
MRRILSLLATLILCLCVGTTLTAAGGVAWGWMQGYWDRDRVTRAVAALHGVELASAATPSEASAGAGPTHDLEALKARARRDVELREQAVQAGIAQLRFLQEKLDADRTRYDQLWAGFQSQLQSLREGAIATGRNNVREIWENIRPKQAKVQIIEMLKEEKGIDEVVSILTQMPIDRRAKIVGEFKTEEEQEKMTEILRLIRDGLPDVKMIDDAAAKLQEAKPN